jgi:hypothetical protein
MGIASILVGGWLVLNNTSRINATRTKQKSRVIR